VGEEALELALVHVRVAHRVDEDLRDGHALGLVCWDGGGGRDGQVDAMLLGRWDAVPVVHGAYVGVYRQTAMHIYIRTSASEIRSAAVSWLRALSE